MILKGEDRATIRASLTVAGATPAIIKTAIEQASKRIAIAANYDKTEQVGLSIKRLNEIFGTSVEMADPKTALAAQKELNKLMDLYRAEPGEANSEGESAAEKEINAALAHLQPLEIAHPDTPLSELCRIAAQLID